MQVRDKGDRDMRERTPHRYRSSGLVRLGARTVLISAVLSVVLGQSWVGASTSGSVGVGALRPVACKPMTSDPPLEAPLYAQQEGASSRTDGWWCQLPHATEMPANLIPFRRDVASLPEDYALYSTIYTEQGTVGGTSVSSTAGPTVTVTSDVNSSVDPGSPRHTPPPSGGKQLALANGVTATVVSKDGFVEVTWPYPSSGVPKYLEGVASVTVTGIEIPEPVVLAVARHVAPD